MRVALCQINPTVGDLAGNCRKILSFIERAKAQRAELAVFPELSVTGYPPKDLLLKPQFIDDNLRAVALIASRVSGLDVIVGYADRNTQPIGRPLHNAVAVLRDGKIVSRHFKTLLPTYDVFDEGRYFEPGPRDVGENLVRIGDAIVGQSICEDLWNDERLIPRRLYHENPIADLIAAGAEILVNASASPFVVGKHSFRLELFSTQVKRFRKPLVYVNQVGGNDELVFDGNSVVFDASGNVIAQAKAFEEDLVVVEVMKGKDQAGGAGPAPLEGTKDEGEAAAARRSALRLQPSAMSPTISPSIRYAISNGESAEHAIESVYQALVLGLRDYVRKTGFKSVVLGLSGGIDSALTAAVAVDALGKDKVVGVAMPSRYSSEHSVIDARVVAENLGIAFHVVPIKSVHDAFDQSLAPIFAGRKPDVTEENLQARCRGVLLMAFSNKFNHLLLTTGNKSELAVGYCTLYGDMCGGLAVISDVPKTTVYELCEFINARAARDVIPRNTITKPPSAELRPDQTDQDSLPPYPVLDGILFRYVEEDEGPAEIVAAGYEPETVARVIRLIDRSEYKRRQAATGLKVTSRAFGFGRRMPIAQGYEPALPKHGEPSPVLE